MKAVEVAGDSVPLKIGSREIPAPKLGQVLIEVCAAGVNRADILQRNGKYPPPIGASDILGLEVSGIIIETGENVSAFKEGDKVMALLEGGGYASHVIANEACILPMPVNTDYVQAASLPEALFTAWSNLFTYADMQRGETLLFHGGTSGIGVIALQMANRFGVKSIATAGSRKKCDFLEILGVENAINYKEQDFVEIVKGLGGADVVIDMVGGDYWSKNLKVLKEEGRLISMAMMGGAKAEVNFVPLLINNLCVKGTTLRNKPLAFKKKIRDELIEYIMPMIESGDIRPVIDTVFELNDVQKAHNLMETSEHIGKIVLKID